MLKITKLLFGLVFTALVSLPLPAWTWVKTITFEGGTVGANATSVYGFSDAGASVTFASAQVKNGTRSAGVSFTACGTVWPTVAFNYTPYFSYGNHIWQRMWVYLPSNWSWAGCLPEQADRIKWMRIALSSGQISLLLSEYGFIRPSNEADPSNNENPVHTNPLNEVSPTSAQATLQAGEWVELEQYVYLHESAGIHRLWKNGTLIYQNTSCKTATAGVSNNDTHHWGTWNRNCASNQTLYVDDITVQTDTPTNQDSYGNYMISGSSGGVTPDTTPAVMSNATPSGTLTCTTNPGNRTVGISTNEAATCRYGTAAQWAAGADTYDELPSTFSSTGGTTHSSSLSLACNAAYAYRALCQDVAGIKNTTPINITFSIDALIEEPDFITGTRFGENSSASVSGVCTDTSLSGETNRSTTELLTTYTWPVDTSINTVILKFDLSSVPTNAVITDAKLYLYQTASGGDATYAVSAHRISGDTPVIASATWLTYNGSTSWGATPGGRGDIEEAETTNSLNSTAGWKVWDVDTMVGVWVATPATNKGMLLDSDSVAAVDSYRYFASSNNTDASLRPMLIIAYTIPAPANRTISIGAGSQSLTTGGSQTLSW